MTTAASWVLTLAVAGQLAASAPPARDNQALPPPFPRPNATKLLETDRLVVWDIVWPKGQPSPLHRHVFDQVGTYYQAGGRAITQQNGTRSENTTAVGAISTTRKGTTHIEEGITEPPLRAVFIEMKSDTPSTQSGERGLAPPRPGARQVHSEERVTAWDVTWSTGTAPSISYSRDTVVVWLGSGTFRVTKNGQTPDVVSVKPGSTWYRTSGTVESDELTAGSPRAIIFEFR
jgi:hypothetical protein